MAKPLSEKKGAAALNLMEIMDSLNLPIGMEK
jgi:hypothetical protein